LNAASVNRRGSYQAPWSPLLKGVSLAASLVLLGSVVLVWVVVPEEAAWVRWAVPAMNLLILGGTGLLTVRGYELRGRELLVRRLVWKSKVSLEGLREAHVDEAALRHAIRVMGNGGLFAFSGWYWSKRLGRFKAFATDPGRAVVLVYRDRKVVVTPDRPEHFVRALGYEVEGKKILS
jgi:hypothetical protein